MDTIITSGPQYLGVCVVCTVLFSESLKKVLKPTKLGTLLKGFYFVYPFLFSVLTTLLVYISGQHDVAWKAFASDILTVYGTSVFSYETIAKRIFGKFDKEEKDEGSDNNDSHNASVAADSDSGNSSVVGDETEGQTRD